MGLSPSAAKTGEAWVPQPVLTEQLTLFADSHCWRGKSCREQCSNWMSLHRGKARRQRTGSAK